MNWAKGEGSAAHPFVVAKEFEVETMYGISGNPTAVLIDRGGIVRRFLIGSDEIADPKLDTTIQSLLAEQPPLVK